MEKKVKARIIVKGRVQDVGYRTIVKQIARGFGIKGMVRNAENGSVEIFCETGGKTLDGFKKLINIKSPPEDLFGVNVEKIDEYDEDSKNYVNPPEKFEYFHIDYLNEDLLKTSVERAEIGILAFKAMHKDLKEGQNDLKEGQDMMLGKQDKMLGKQDKMLDGQSAMHGDIKDLRDITRDSFTELKNTYGVFHKTMGSMQEELISTRKELSKLVDYIGVLVKEHIQKTEK